VQFGGRLLPGTEGRWMLVTQHYVYLILFTKLYRLFVEVWKLCVLGTS